MARTFTIKVTKEKRALVNTSFALTVAIQRQLNTQCLCNF